MHTKYICMSVCMYICACRYLATNKHSTFPNFTPTYYVIPVQQLSTFFNYR